MKKQKQRRLESRVLIHTLMWGSFVIGNAAYSQGAAATENGGINARGVAALEEVVVTSQRRAQSLQDVPIAVTAVTPEMAQQFGFNNIQDMTLVAPSVDASATPGFLKLYMRGLGQAYVTPGLESPVAVYLDGGYVQRLGGFNSLLDIVDIDRIEVLRGPQGTLYGRNATGGAMLLHTADPTEYFEGRIAAEYGRFNHRKVEGMVNIPLTDKVSARFAASTVRSDGYIKNIATGTDLYNDDSYTVRGKVRWQPNDIADVVLGVEYQESTPRRYANQRSSGAPVCYLCQSMGDGPTGFYKANHEDMPDWEVSLLRANLNATFSFGNHELTSHTGFLEDDVVQFSDTDGTPAPIFYYNVYGMGGETFTQEFVLSSQYDGPLNFLVGLSYLKDDALIDIALEGISFSYLPAYPRAVNNVETESVAAFAEFTYDLTDNVTATLGGRFTKDNRRLDAVNNAGFQAWFLPASFTLKDKYDAFTPRFVLSWSNSNTNVYYSYTEGFKAGGFPTPATREINAVDPEEIKSHEIGIKHQAFDDRLTTNLAVFYYEDKDFHSQVTDAVGGGNITQNAGGVRGQGIEMEVSALLTPGLAVGLSFTYLDVEYSSYKNAAAVCVDSSWTGDPNNPVPWLVDCSIDLSGERVPSAPKYAGSVYASYDFQISDWDVNVSGLVHSRSSYDFFPGAGGELGHDKQSYTIANLSGYVSPPGSNIRVGFYLDNVFGEEYAIYRSTGAPYGTGYVAASPRTYGARFAFEF